MCAYSIIEVHDWDSLKSMILSGYREDMLDYDHKDYPLIFEVIHSKDPGASDMASFWLAHGYPHRVRGGRTRHTISHAVASAGLPDVLEKLIGLIADVNLDDADGNTPLWDAARGGNDECVRILLQSGADSDGFQERPENLADANADTPLAVAANAEISKMLLNGCASISIGMYSDSVIEDPMQRQFRNEIISPVARACLDGREETDKFMLDKGADTNALDGQPMG